MPGTHEPQLNSNVLLRTYWYCGAPNIIYQVPGMYYFVLLSVFFHRNAFSFTAIKYVRRSLFRFCAHGLDFKEWATNSVCVYYQQYARTSSSSSHGSILVGKTFTSYYSVLYIKCHLVPGMYHTMCTYVRIILPVLKYTGILARRWKMAQQVPQQQLSAAA